MQFSRTTKCLMITIAHKHIDATEIAECRCLVILTWMCLPLQQSLFCSTNFTARSRAGSALFHY